MTVTSIVVYLVIALAIAIVATSWLTSGGNKSSHQQLEDGTYVRNNDPKKRSHYGNYSAFN